MKLAFGCVVMAAAAGAVDFGSAAGWTFRNYNDRLSFDAEAVVDGTKCLAVIGSTNDCDTAWNACSAKQPLPPGSCEFVISFEIRSGKFVRDAGHAGESWNNAVAFYDAAGKKIGAQALPHAVVGGTGLFQRVTDWGRIPEGAVSYTVQVGFDSPNVGPKETVCYRGLVFEALPASRSRAKEFEAKWADGSWARDLLYPPEKRAVPRITLRDDGMTLVDGVPYFPIGIYSVCRREFNGMNLDRAFADLKEAGFNFAHTYGDTYDPEFLAAARKYGFKIWAKARLPDRKLLDIGRNDPTVLAWYLGDDTSEHIKPLELLDYHRAVKAVDPWRLTCQADPIYSHWSISRYAAYVRGTDVFMPEIYPVRGKAGDPSDTNCVAVTVRDMQCVAADVRRYGDGQPRGCWPIIQYFKGWGGWDHFPTREQLLATTWAAVIHGAHGMTWYTYGGFENKKTGKKNEGITSTPERWQAISDLARHLNRLSPVLVERTLPELQPKVEIVSGPAKDPLGENPSVTCLVKKHDGRGYLFAVNASPEPVTARLVRADGTSTVLELPGFGVRVPEDVR